MDELGINPGYIVPEFTFLISSTLAVDKKKIIDLFTLFDKISIHGDFFSKENVKDDSNISTIGKRLDAHL